MCVPGSNESSAGKGEGGSGKWEVPDVSVYTEAAAPSMVTTTGWSTHAHKETAPVWV